MPATGVLWLLLCLQRGLLQSARAYREVGLSVLFEALGRLALAVVLVAAGLGVTGAYLGTLASLALTAAALAWLQRRRLGPPDLDSRPHPLPALVRDATLPIAALTLVAALQNVDVIMAKHVLTDDGRRRLRRDDGGRQGGGLDRRRPRLLGAAGGHPPRRRRPRPAPGARRARWR